ncbi:hypothetical protein DFJ77DRAFT_440684 [Powellomyces hirtus]|nr:hypothetical protein DFJ77DRAFT_440684 [Powellomyces hirtus]
MGNAECAIEWRVKDQPNQRRNGLRCRPWRFINNTEPRQKSETQRKATEGGRGWGASGTPEHSSQYTRQSRQLRRNTQMMSVCPLQHNSDCTICVSVAMRAGGYRSHPSVIVILSSVLLLLPYSRTIASADRVLLPPTSLSIKKMLRSEAERRLSIREVMVTARDGLRTVRSKTHVLGRSKAAAGGWDSNGNLALGWESALGPKPSRYKRAALFSLSGLASYVHSPACNSMLIAHSHPGVLHPAFRVPSRDGCGEGSQMRNASANRGAMSAALVEIRRYESREVGKKAEVGLEGGQRSLTLTWYRKVLWMDTKKKSRTAIDTSPRIVCHIALPLHCRPEFNVYFMIHACPALSGPTGLFSLIPAQRWRETCRSLVNAADAKARDGRDPLTEFRGPTIEGIAFVILGHKIAQSPTPRFGSKVL